MFPEDMDATLQEIDRVMADGGFAIIESPLTIGGIPFEVIRAYVADPGFLDLVVVIDAR